MGSEKENVLGALQRVIGRIQRHDGPVSVRVETGVDANNPTDILGIISYRLVGAAEEVEIPDTVEIVDETEGNQTEPAV